MALSTQQYKQEAIALLETGLGPRAVERELTQKYGARVVAYPTIRNWLLEGKEKPELCRIQQA